MEGMHQSIAVADFFDRAPEMRAAFDERFGAVRSGSRKRFVWDYWHVPHQYTYLRTFSEYVFAAELYAAFMRRLRSWGRDQLGCEKVMAPWLSCYVDGCRQELHADVPHGPWAYVFSLTDWDHRTFLGGETMLLKPECLNFWRRFDPSIGLEADSLVELIPPQFNQLTVFDPRIPHGVRPVQGTWDPVRSRLVLHGWFRYPSPILCEALEGKLTAPVLDSTRESLEERLKDFHRLTGVVTARLELSPSGEVTEVRTLTNTLVSKDGHPEDVSTALRCIEGFWAQSKFPQGAENAWVIMPVRLPVSRNEAI